VRKVSVASSASGSGKHPIKFPFRFSNLQNCLLNLIEPRGCFSYKFDYNAGEGRAEGPSIAAFNMGDPLHLRQVVALHEKSCSPVHGRWKRIEPIRQASEAGGSSVHGQGLMSGEESQVLAHKRNGLACSPDVVRMGFIGIRSYGRPRRLRGKLGSSNPRRSRKGNTKEVQRDFEPRESRPMDQSRTCIDRAKHLSGLRRRPLERPPPSRRPRRHSVQG